MKIRVLPTSRFRLMAFGDCSNCRHSLMYHVPMFGCMKCDCDEFE